MDSECVCVGMEDGHELHFLGSGSVRLTHSRSGRLSSDMGSDNINIGDREAIRYKSIGIEDI